MKRTNTATAILALTLFLTCLSAGCGVPEEQQNSSERIDLRALLDVARVRTETTVIPLADEHLETYFARGWSEVLQAEDGSSRVAAVQKNVALRFNILDERERWLRLRVYLDGQLGSLEQQIIGLKFNLLDLEPITLNGPGPHDLVIELPVGQQHEGVNRVVFTFDNFARNEAYFNSNRRARFRETHRGVALYLSEPAILIGSTDASEGILQESEPKLVTRAGDGESIAQRPNSHLRFAFDIPAEAKLHIQGQLQPAESGGPYRATITALNDIDPLETVLWQREITGEAPADTLKIEESLSLQEFAGQTALITFSVISTGQARSGGVVWQQMAINSPNLERERAAAQQRETINLSGQVEHVVIIVLDALRADVLGAYGNEEGLTPYMDALAEESIVFLDTITPAPYTISSCSSLFSGQLPDRHGVLDGRDRYPDELQNLIGTLNEEGWFTASLAGTQFLTRKYGLTREVTFETYLRREEDKQAEVSTMDMSRVEAGIDAALASGKRSFIYMHLLPPHWPYRPPAPYDTRLIDSTTITKDYLRRIRAFRGNPDHPLVQELALHYRNNTMYADALVGQVLDMLQEKGMRDNTMIIVTSDHGEAFAEHGALEHGNTVYDEMISVPFIAHVPGVAPARIEQQISWVDLFPTFLEVFGIQREYSFDGRSIAPLLAGKQISPAVSYYARAFGDKLKFTLRGEQFKYIYMDGVDLLFDRISDPGEQENIAQLMPALTAALRQRGLLLVETMRLQGSGNTAEVELTEAEEEELRNLGYLQ